MTFRSASRYFAILIVASLCLWWRVFVDVFALSVKSDAYTHLLLIIPIGVVLVLLSWRRRLPSPDPGYVLGALMLGVAILLAVAGARWSKINVITPDIHLSLEMLAVVLWWMASFVLCFGIRVFRNSLFPILFFLWLIPLPEFAMSRTVHFLQDGTASFTCDLFRGVGIPATLDGTRVSIPGLTVEVAEECSSIRSSTILVITTMALSYVLLNSWWARSFVIVAVLPLSIAKNGFRVFVLEGLAAYVDPGVLNSPLHHHGGILFLALALGMIVGLIWLLRILERRVSLPHVQTPALSTLLIR